MLVESINNFLTELTPDSSTEYSLWKATKYLKRPIAQVPPITKTDGRWAHNNLEKTNTFAQHLEERFHQNPGLDDYQFLTKMITWARFHWLFLKQQKK
jgi:hypothetical protein